MNYIYLIQPGASPYCKIGRWSGSVSALRSRYSTYYPQIDEMALFQVKSDDSPTSIERRIHEDCADFLIERELFRREVMDTYLRSAERACQKYCQSIDLNDKLIRITRRENKRLKKEVQRLEKELVRHTFFTTRPVDTLPQQRKDVVEEFLRATPSELRKVICGPENNPEEWFQFRIEVGPNNPDNNIYGSAWTLVQEAFEAYKSGKHFTDILFKEHPAFHRQPLKFVENDRFYSYQDGGRKKTRHVIGLKVTKTHQTSYSD